MPGILGQPRLHHWYIPIIRDSNLIVALRYSNKLREISTYDEVYSGRHTSHKIDPYLSYKREMIRGASFFLWNIAREYRKRRFPADANVGVSPGQRASGPICGDTTARDGWTV